MALLIGARVSFSQAGRIGRDERLPTRTAAILFAILVSAFLLMPLLAVVPVSFTRQRFLSMPDGELSLRHYQALYENPAWGSAILLSLRIGVVSSSIATTLAVMFSLGIWMLRPPFAAFSLASFCCRWWCRRWFLR